MRLSLALGAALALSMTIAGSAWADARARIAAAVDPVVRPLMAQQGIPGMAVGVVVDGREYVLNYGLASKAGARPVQDRTLFELGSISKTFTATLTAYAQASGKLSLSDPVSARLPLLRGSSFDRVSLLNLATHTSGGLPQQVPDAVTSDAELMAYLRAWRPTCAPGACRTYSNISIGLLGLIAAQTLHGDFAALMEGRLFPMLGLRHAWIRVPAAEMADYAQGYTRDGAPIRMSPGELADEAYGVRTTAGDMIHFVAENIDPSRLDPRLARAIRDTHVGYFAIGPMTQDLIWEQYRYPVALPDLLEGNSSRMAYESVPATPIAPPRPPQSQALLDKTGSTNGFGAYVAFVPGRRIGVVLLANKSYPLEARVSAGHAILAALEGERAQVAHRQGF